MHPSRQAYVEEAEQEVLLRSPPSRKLTLQDADMGGIDLANVRTFPSL
jgi:hypothetical protein